MRFAALVSVFTLNIISCLHGEEQSDNLVLTLTNRTQRGLLLKVSWTPYGCTQGGTPPSRYVLTINNVTKEVRDVKAIISVRYWRQYNVTVKPKCRHGVYNITQTISTGPPPLRPVGCIRVSNIKETSGLLVWCDRNYTPRGLSMNKTYLIRVMTDGEVVQDLQTNRTVMEVLGLIPNTKYEIGVQLATIIGGTNYSSPWKKVVFSTRRIENFPNPFDLRNNITGDHQLYNISIQFQVPQLPLRTSGSSEEGTSPTYFNVSLSMTSNSSNTFSLNRTVDIPQFDVTNLTQYGNITIRILPVWVIGGQKEFFGNASVFSVQIPKIDLPEAANISSLPMSPRTEVISWEANGDGGDYVSWKVHVTCNSKHETYLVIFDERSLTIEQLAAGEQCSLTIQSVAEFEDGKLAGSIVVYNFSTIEHDYESPQNLTSHIDQTSSDSVVYVITWDPPQYHQASLYRLSQCQTDNCLEQRLNKTSGVISADYFSNYTIHITAEYTLSADQKILRSNSMNLTTVGRAPSAVRNLSITNITSTSVSLKWEKPSDYSQWISDYRVIDPTNQLEVVTEGLSAHLRNLSIFHLYHLQVIPRINFTGDTYMGPAVNLSVTTEAGAPGSIENLRASRLGVNEYFITWDRPIPANGPISYYRIRIADDKGWPVNELSSRLENATILLSEMETSAYLNITVSAVNFISNQPLQGPASSIVLLLSPLSESTGMPYINNDLDATKDSLEISETSKENSFIESNEIESEELHTHREGRLTDPDVDETMQLKSRWSTAKPAVLSSVVLLIMCVTIAWVLRGKRHLVAREVIVAHFYVNHPGKDEPPLDHHLEDQMAKR